MPIRNDLVSAIRADAKRQFSHWERTSGLGAYTRLIFLCPGFQLALCLRFQEAVGRVPKAGFFLRRVAWYFTTMWFGCDIDPHATIGPGIHFPHPTGIVIGGEWDIGANVSILQGVTLGRGHEEPVTRSTVGDGAVLTAGAKVIGNVSIGSGAVVGANAVVLQDVPPGFVAVGVPARMIEPRSRKSDKPL